MKGEILVWIKNNKWLVAGLVIAVLNPVPSGVILVIVTFLIFLISTKR